MFKYIFIITFSILALFSKQSTFASASLENPLDIAWEQAHQIAAKRSQYLKSAISIIKSQESEDRIYKSLFFNLPASMEVKITQDLENSCQIWSLFERTLNYYQDIPDRLVMLELLLGEIARISHIADSDWSVHVINIGTQVRGEALAFGLTSPSPLGRPQFIDVVRKNGTIETYAIIPGSNIATQCAYEDHLAWKQMWTILKTQKEDYSPTVDKNVIGKGSNIVDKFFNIMGFNALTRSILIGLEKTSADSRIAIEAATELMRARILPIEEMILGIPLAAALALKDSTTTLPEVEVIVKLEEKPSSATPLLDPLSAVAENLAASAAAEKAHTEDAPLNLSLAATALPDALTLVERPRLPTSFVERAFMVPKKLNAKGEREKARERSLKASGSAAAAVGGAEYGEEQASPSKIFTLSRHHYKVLETILKNLTTRKPPRWEAFKNMIKALGGSTDDSSGNGTTDCLVGNGSFNIHTPHEKGDRMYWTQIKKFAKPGLERVGITLETVALKRK